MSEEPRILLLKAHAGENAGVTAGSHAIRTALAGQGKLVAPTEDYDVVVVNGDLPVNGDPLRLSRCIAALQRAVDQGKRGYLVNLTWNDAIPLDADFLRQLSGLGVRGSASARTIAERFGVGCDIMLDMAYYGPAGGAAASPPHAKQILAAGLKPAEVALLAKVTGEQVVELPPVSGWAESVARLASARLLVTRHYNEVLAACKARTPFVALDDGPEIADLLETSRTTIPAARRIRELTPVVQWALENRDVYTKMFAWMARMRPWAGLRTPRPPAEPRLRQLQRGIGAAAVIAEIRHDFVEAEGHWRTLLDERPQDLSVVNRYCQVALKARRIAESALAYVRARATLPDFVSSYQGMSVAIADAPLWRYHGQTAPFWWAAATRAVELAQKDAPLADVHQAISACLNEAATAGPEMRDAALTLVSERLLQLNCFAPVVPLFFEPRPGVPVEVRLFDQVRLDCLRRHYDADVKERIAGLRTTPSWQDIRVRCQVRGLEWLAAGAGAVDLDAAMADAGEVGPHKAMASLQAFGIAADRGQMDVCRSLLEATPELRLQVGNCMAVAGLIAATPALARDMTQLGRALELDRLRGDLATKADALLRHLADPAVSIALVGAGEAGAGAAIDSHDVVIRFEALPTAAMTDDAGRRTDVLVVTRTNPDIARPQGVPAGLTLLIDSPLSVVQAREWTPALAMWRAGVTLAEMPEAGRLDLFAQLGRSSGSATRLLDLLRRHGRSSGVDLYGLSADSDAEAALQRELATPEPVPVVDDAAMAQPAEVQSPAG